jgi:GntR family histidine utilization transcriptional repressor
MSQNGAARVPPLYEQVKQEILSRIANGEWADGAKLPSEHELVELFGTSRMTVHRAMRELSTQGVLTRFQGIGTFVAPPAPRSELIQIRDIADDIGFRGHSHRCEIVKLEAVRADIDLATTFDRSIGAKIFHSVIVHYEDDAPIQLEERFVNPGFAPRYLEQDFTELTPAHYLQSVQRATEVEQIIYAGAADCVSQELLEMKAGEPCLFMMRRTWLDDLPATKNLFTYPGARYSLGSRYKTADYNSARA